ncbi:MAG: bifunctional folylpolyglutamate synthase/dihydrofolate synthase [Candidatus Cloacimonetes bacterium]|nr:bifunctional folylpolyglutamate synthase/dihydrofolate synthase [Candidatus Cloacimonadota bacterium]
MKYQEFLDYIYQRHSGNVKLGLERMLKILEQMDNPNKKLNGIHIAGTNGKGSVAAICEALSIGSCLKTGLNTSPHLQDYRERIRLNGRNITFEKLMETYKLFEETFEANEASFFEITTAMAFYYFMINKVENAIFEVGLGGRLDGTNPFSSTITVITSISYDHTKSLGASIQKIATEKAGILKENTPLVLGKMNSIARKTIREIANNKNITVYQFGKDFKISNVSINLKGTTFDYCFKNISLKKIKTNLIGFHQAENAATAITSFVLFLEEIQKEINPEIIRNSLLKINWIGRMQILCRKPLVMIDGAHNEEGVKALTKNLKELFPNRKIRFVLAILRDKKIESIIKEICDTAFKVYISKNKSTRAAEIEDQVKFVKNHDIKYETIPDVMNATRKAIKESKNDDVVIVSGSLYTISEVLKAEETTFRK